MESIIAKSGASYAAIMYGFADSLHNLGRDIGQLYIHLQKLCFLFFLQGGIVFQQIVNQWFNVFCEAILLLSDEHTALFEKTDERLESWGVSIDNVFQCCQ